MVLKVRQLEAQVTNTLGWSATTGKVEPWVYQRISETFVLDEEMRNRISDLNPTASSRMANRLLEANDRSTGTQILKQSLHFKTQRILLRIEWKE